MVFVKERLRQFERTLVDLRLPPVTSKLLRLAFFAGAGAVVERMYKTAEAGASDEVGQATFSGLLEGVIAEYKKAQQDLGLDN